VGTFTKRIAYSRLDICVFALLLGYLICLVTLSAAKSIGSFTGQIALIEWMLGGDKWTHFTLSVLLAFLTCLATGRVLGLRPSRTLFLLFSLMVSSLVIDECMQQFFTTRRFDLVDLGCGVMGLVVGLLIYVLAVKSVQMRIGASLSQQDAKKKLG
jgi:hypothetical protein